MQSGLIASRKLSESALETRDRVGDAKFRLMALEDPDLEPLWASLST